MYIDHGSFSAILVDFQYIQIIAVTKEFEMNKKLMQNSRPLEKIKSCNLQFQKSSFIKLTILHLLLEEEIMLE